ncbi:MAG: bifunctional phosphoribosylaminoimidazolecarboxamide formyltransferase/IMP cyclohydrolase [Planctomycetes bacterium]|nr:bifunctional phosphoribosylaminoimidazolecarboxamide formyltransferase/IMP cyclohydrolase [Planctomycetota bacterium]
MTRAGKPHALFSVSDKTGVVDFARTVAANGFVILSTGGTAKALRDGGIEVVDVADYTGYPEMMDGRLKTLHPMVHGGLLARRDDQAHVAAMEEHGMASIDLVVVNLYPFEATVQKPDVTRDAAIEQIDIGGPTMLRSAAKNHASVTVVCDPTDYERVAAAIDAGDVPETLRRDLARKVFAHTASYDAAIARWLAKNDAGEAFPDVWITSMRRERELRYGENPHQRAAFYVDPSARPDTIAGARFLGSNKEISYNNLLDLDAALALIREFTPDIAACAILKHNNPCGAGLGSNLAIAFRNALSGDPVSAFGSIVSTNVPVDRLAANEIAKPGNFVEALIAPAVDDDALEILRSAKFGKNLRILVTGPIGADTDTQVVRAVAGGLLVQDSDTARVRPELEYVTTRRPDGEEMRDLRFAWAICKHVRSNAIVLAKADTIVGVGAGQMSRVDSVRIATHKAEDRSQGSVLASDAFFPFPDGIELAAERGVRAVIQPGGSRKDDEVIAAADRAGVAMVFTGRRHFRH